MLRAITLTVLLMLSSAAVPGTPVDAGEQAAERMMSQSLEGPTPSGIADPRLAAEWAALREALGLEPESRLYVFVSFSMPDSLLRAYALDAARAGGELVFRGIEQGTDIRSFIMDRLLEVLQPGGLTAPVQIDPRLFDAYSIEHVPTIVLAREPEEGICPRAVPRKAELAGREYAYDGCPSRPEGSYWKVSGSVTTLYALEAFRDQGAPFASPFIEALRSQGGQAMPEQRELTKSQWDSLAEELAERNAERLRERYQDSELDVYDTPWGPAVGPEGMPTEHLEEAR